MSILGRSLATFFKNLSGVYDGGEPPLVATIPLQNALGQNFHQNIASLSGPQASQQIAIVTIPHDGWYMVESLIIVTDGLTAALRMFFEIRNEAGSGLFAESHYVAAALGSEARATQMSGGKVYFLKKDWTVVNGNTDALVVGDAVIGYVTCVELFQPA